LSAPQPKDARTKEGRRREALAAGLVAKAEFALSPKRGVARAGRMTDRKSDFAKPLGPAGGSVNRDCHAAARENSRRTHGGAPRHISPI